jgi:hypothetical protein
VKPLSAQRFLRTSASASASAVVSNARSENHSQVSTLERSGNEPWKTSRMAANQKSRERNVLRQSATDKNAKDKEEPSDMKVGRRAATKMSTSDWNKRRAELRFLRDPLELATFVKKELAKGKSAEMLQLVQMASHSMECIVSWNHIIDHYLAKEKVNDALKVYNDVRAPCHNPLRNTNSA